jgi:hypothetical protein
MGWEDYQLGDLNNLFGSDTSSSSEGVSIINPETGNSLTSEYNDIADSLLGGDSSGGFDWGKVLSGAASTAGGSLAKLWDYYTKNKSDNANLEYLKDKSKKELLADLVRSLVTSKKKESSKSVHAGFGPTVGLPSLGSAGSVNPNYPYPKSSGFNPQLAMKIASLLGRG